MSTSIATTDNQTQKIDNVSILTNGELFNRLRTLSEVMANSGNFVPAHFRGKPDSCMAVVMQAARWGMDPFAVAQKTFIVGDSGVLGYEAQLVNAVVNSMAPTKDRIHFEWFGAWENIVGRFVEKTSTKGNKYIAPGWSLADEKGVGVRAFATLKGESEPRELILMLSQAQVRNSTLWASDPRQQLAYLAVKRWARLYCPDVILGVYTADEIEEREEKIINPVQSTQNITMQDITADNPQTTSTQIADADTDAMADKFRARIDSAETLEDATAIGNDINAAKPSLGTALFTELKNKATRRYHLVKHRNLVETAINSIPRPGEPESLAGFESAEKALTTAKRHIGDELYDKYRINLNDMKPEYITA
ncbi:recombinase RecT [Salmonella enterica]|uniref:Recombinase RecT n=4 Tax=Salmonella enterica TaxID=28901 RepID=A0A5U3D1S4_SALDZ|nr:enterohemolysin [Salmonella enterica subsp. enterica serovar Java]EAA3224519.1 enterohemolysin [Salmonella enterica subsp. enterica serovar Newport]EAA7929676.1 enterohemolysin [Salmonella enterica subsp. enterica serovar Redlands]EAA8668824.1 enterohemolysin [Salmonella enterica]EAA8761571.1 enterohemolysin [Salmonella enterica subsp. enterica serovar Rubislaw]EBP3413033.1 recombinase RecT [Salmonella enterica subsp. diarizonae]EBP3904918.1 recombinase RecT [Salmonella enterica subsp. ent